MFRTTVLTVMLCFSLAVSTAWSASSQPDEVMDFLRHRNVLLSVDFDFGSHKLTETSRHSIDRVAGDLKELLGEQKIVRIEGYATPQGKEDYNLVLSMQRAMEVQRYLMNRYGLELDLYFNGYGSGREPSETLVQLTFYDDTLGLKVANIDDVVTQ